MVTAKDQLASQRSAKGQLSAIREQQKNGFWEELYGSPKRALSNINIGISYILGMPRAIQDAGLYLANQQEEKTELPTGEKVDLYESAKNPFFKFPSQQEARSFMEETGMIQKNMPDDFVDRVYQNIGASLIPGGLMTRGSTALFASMITPEIIASVGGAGGGKIMERTEWGSKNPELARALGELGGGLGLSLGANAIQAGAKGIGKWYGRGGFFGYLYRQLREPYTGAKAKQRAVLRVQEMTTESGSALGKLQENVPDADILTPIQRARDSRLAKLAASVDVEEPALQEARQRQRAIATEQLKKRIPSGDVEDARNFLTAKFNQLLEEADELLKKATTARDSAEISVHVRGKIEQALKVARKEEEAIWNNLPTKVKVQPENLTQTYIGELSNITRGGDPAEIIPFIREKLGIVKKDGSLAGGKLINKKYKTPTTKELHQFYSVLGRKMSELADKGGQQNKIRIIKELRRAILEDIDSAGVTEYDEAIEFSRKLNDKFTSGDIGKVLGYSRGANPRETEALDILFGGQGQRAKENALHLLESTPGAKQDIFDFVKTRFAQSSVNKNNNKINTKAGREFIKRNEKLLDEFPELKKELVDATEKQRAVDDFVGASDVSQYSPLSNERAAASVFLGQDPGDEIGAIIRIKSGKKTQYLTDLVNETKKDPTGKAYDGLKNAVAQELLDYSSMKTRVGEVIEESFVSGTKFLQRLKQLEHTFTKSGLLTSKEVERLKQLGRAFEGIEIELKATSGGPIISDSPSKLATKAAQVLAARLGGKLGKESAGGSLQTASIFSSEAKGIITKLTNDDARNLLVKAVTDEEILADLLTDASKLKPQEQVGLMTRLLDKAKGLRAKSPTKESAGMIPAAAITPPIVTLTSDREQPQTAKQRLKDLRSKPQQPVVIDRRQDPEGKWWQYTEESGWQRE